MKKFFKELLNLIIHPNKDDIYIKIWFGMLQHLTFFLIILKIFKLWKYKWITTLVPLWLALISGAIIGLWWAIVEIVELHKQIKKESNED